MKLCIFCKLLTKNNESFFTQYLCRKIKLWVGGKCSHVNVTVVNLAKVLVILVTISATKTLFDLQKYPEVHPRIHRNLSDLSVKGIFCLHQTHIYDTPNYDEKYVSYKHFACDNIFKLHFSTHCDGYTVH